MFSLLCLLFVSVFFTFRDNRRPLSALLNIAENRWNEIENKLENLSSRVSSLRLQLGLTPANESVTKSRGGEKAILKDFVIQASPDSPPYSVQFFLLALSQIYPIYTSVHVHSSLTKDIPYDLKDFLEVQKENTISNCNDRNTCTYGITIIWKAMGKDPVLIVNPTGRVEGEVNIIRYLSRLMESLSNNCYVVKHLINYDLLSPAKVAQIDEILDSIHQFIHNECPNQRKRLLGQLLNCKTTSVNETSSIVDIALLSICKQEQERNSNFLSKNDKQAVKAIKSRCVMSNPFVKESLLIL